MIAIQPQRKSAAFHSYSLNENSDDTRLIMVERRISLPVSSADVLVK